MFRLFLIDRLISAHQIERGDQARKNNLPARRLRNRRIYERFSINSKHIALMNEQDILVIRDISETGFSTEVSTRGFERLLVGDVYRCRLRYLKEIFDLEVKVTWKSKNFVGFELLQADEEIKSFLHRLIAPIEIGSSLKKVEPVISKDEVGVKEWFQGECETSLFVWRNNSGELNAWQLEDESEYVGWNQEEGFRTGSVSVSEQVVGMSQPWKKTFSSDKTVNNKQLQHATDIIMAFQGQDQSDILNTLIG